MTVSPGVVVPAIPPRPPQLSLIGSAVRPDLTSDPTNPVWQVGDSQLAMLPDDLRQELEARKGESWTRGFTYAPENHWPGELRDACDQATSDTPPLPAPQGLTTAASATGGTLTHAASPYSYQVTAVNPNGQTTALPAVVATIAAGSTGSVLLAWQPAGDSAGVTYNVFGRQAGSIGLIATVGPFDDDQTPTYTDTGAATPGAARRARTPPAASDPTPTWRSTRSSRTSSSARTGAPPGDLRSATSRAARCGCWRTRRRRRSRRSSGPGRSRRLTATPTGTSPTQTSST